MKKPFFLLLLFLALIMAACVPNTSDKRMFRWPATIPDFDSTAVRLERTYLFQEPSTLHDSLLQRLSTILSTEKGDKNMQAQLLFWQGRNQKRLEHDSLAYVMFSRALSLTDSAKTPYQFARIALARASLRFVSVEETYHTYRNELAYFEKTGDSLMTAETLVRLGNIFWQVEDTLTAVAGAIRHIGIVGNPRLVLAVLLVAVKVGHHLAVAREVDIDDVPLSRAVYQRLERVGRALRMDAVHRPGAGGRLDSIACLSDKARHPGAERIWR